MRIVPDTGTRLIAGGAVLVGGSPVRVLRLTPAGSRQVAGWLSGSPVSASAAARGLARRLLDSGAAHPDWPANQEPAGQRQPLNPGQPPNPGEADVTVVIPVRDRHAELARCLAGLRAAAESPPVPADPDGSHRVSSDNSKKRGSAAGLPARSLVPRVIVVDDASADPRAIAVIAARHGATVIRRPVNGGPGAARNAGLAAAGTELVAFLDSDCVPAAGWLDRLLPHFADPAVGAVAPRIVPHTQGTSWLARYEGASSTLDMGARPSVVRPGARVSYVPGAALVVRRSAAGDGFTAGMCVGEDVDFVWRLSDAGWRVRYEPAAVMGHDHRVTFRAWFWRRADYGTSAAALEELHPGAVRPLYASWWTVGAWAAALAGRPLAAAALTGTATALLARRLSRVTGEPWPVPGPPSWRPPTARSCAVTPGKRPAKTHDDAIGKDNSKKRASAAWVLAVRLAGGGTLAAARPLGSALSRTWWPVAIPAAVAVRRLRLPVAALILAPPLLDWADRRPPLDPVRYVAARLLDDAAYSIGVWQGCLRRRTLRALLPSIGGRTGAREREVSARPGT
jgi:GT2 family glycosyltransferase